MAQSLSKYISKEYQAKIEIGAPTGTFTVGTVVANNSSLASATFYALVKKVVANGASSYLIVEPFAPLTVNGVVRDSTAMVADAETLYGFVQSSGASTGASAVVDTVANADGSDIILTSNGIERVRKIGTRVVSEVLVALKHFKHRFAALIDFDTPATISTAVVSGSAGNVVDISNGNTIRLTLTASEPITVPDTATVSFTTATGTNTRNFTYSSGAGTTSVVFSYTPVAADIGIAGTVGGLETVVVGGIQEVSVQDGKSYTNGISSTIPAATGAAAISIQA